MTERPTPVRNRPRLLQRGSWPERRFVGDILRTETVGGALLLIAAAAALFWANSPWSQSYFGLGAFVPVPQAQSLHLDLTLSQWAADGLLAIFFFVVGLELKREFVAGDLRDPRRAALPIVAAVGGMVIPALIYFAVNAGGAGAAGWAIPTATDIAFALAVLAVVNSHLPHALRAFLLTLAVVDDLLAITVIAIFYTAGFSPLPLLAALIPLALFTLLVQARKTWWTEADGVGEHEQERHEDRREVHHDGDHRPARHEPASTRSSASGEAPTSAEEALGSFSRTVSENMFGRPRSSPLASMTDSSGRVIQPELSRLRM